MNANFFNSVLSMQDPLSDTLGQAGSYSQLNDPLESFFNRGYQNDGRQMQSFRSDALQAVPAGLFAVIANAIRQYFQSMGLQSDSNGGTTPFQDVDLASVGDPHDAINGTTQSGRRIDKHWDNQESHDDLISAPSIAGGLRISSQVGAANAQGATVNKVVTATANNGRTVISFNANGEATVRQGNIVNTMVDNETLNLGRGLSVTDQGNSLIIHAKDRQGGELTTTLAKNNDGGVDVKSKGRNIALGGYFVKSSSSN